MQNNKFVVIKKAGTKQAEEILQIKLTVREDAKAGISEIKINESIVPNLYKDLYIKAGYSINNMNTLKNFIKKF